MDRLSHRLTALCCAALLASCGGNSSTTSSHTTAAGSDPALQVEPASLQASLVCDEFTHPEHEVVLLVHGTFTHGQEQYNWSLGPLLNERGFDTCTVTYPNRGFGDMQVSAEYIVYAIRQVAAMSGGKIDVVGHSQGAIHPRWALTFWPGIRELVDDFVSHAGPHHGTAITLEDITLALPLPRPAIFYQFSPSSSFYAALNAGDETPGEVDYTNLYTMFDELVQPFTEPPTAALDYGMDNPKVTNLLLQDLCPGRLTDHVTIGLTDKVSIELTIDALANDGPADIERAGGAETLCPLPIPEQLISPGALEGGLSVLASEAAQGFPGIELYDAEPPLMPYAQ